jgi:hypothetical protein
MYVVEGNSGHDLEMPSTEADFSGLPCWSTRHGALEPQMFPFPFSNPFFALAVGLRGSRTSLVHRRQSGLSQAHGSSARIEGVS